jgi:hypothetical protein
MRRMWSRMWKRGIVRARDAALAIMRCPRRPARQAARRSRSDLGDVVTNGVAHESCRAVNAQFPH